MANNTYTTRDGDSADQIAFKYYGTTGNRATEQLLQANPGMAARGPLLPAGLVIQLPAIEATVTTQGVKLWD